MSQRNNLFRKFCINHNPDTKLKLCLDHKRIRNDVKNEIVEPKKKYYE